ncbi:uncharacterized protein LOC131637688 [Vicia villosa]|uniref:uncharacterized protein LOC131637688 n=1 Tax=Vicia villosa TaxID=3911 RepID=UPI00273CF2D9|nr:uncharacterized protein LOC131637688 [Vicia villosa]
MDKGGLGLKNIEAFNSALLIKWKWRIIKGEQAKWKEVLSARYGNIQLLIQKGKEARCNSAVSTWWSDLTKAENRHSGKDFLSGCIFKLGNGSAVSFWKAAWLKEYSLQSIYPNLYDLSTKKYMSVAEAGKEVEEHGLWGDFGIVHPLNLSETVSLEDLKSSLQDVSLSSERLDSVLWRNFPAEGYSVKEGYGLCHVTPEVNDRVGEAAQLKVFERLWRIKIPFRTKAFGWRCLWNRIATKDMLAKRGIVSIASDISCCFCFRYEESIQHILLSCPLAKKICEDVGEWLRVTAVTELSLSHSFNFWFEFFSSKKVKAGKEGFMWLVVCWNIWNARNEIIFKNQTVSLSDLRWDIKIKAWKWLTVGDITHTNSNFYNFCKDPISCLT